VDSDRDVKVRAAIYATSGALRLALTGACTRSIAKNGADETGLAIFSVLWMAFQVPGGAMLWYGVATPKTKRAGGAG
jgi:hypothetical protein